MESQGEDPAQLTYAQLMQRAAEGGNWQRALELFDGEWRSRARRCCCFGLPLLLWALPGKPKGIWCFRPSL